MHNIPINLYVKLVCKCFKLRIMGNKWFSQRKCLPLAQATNRPKRRCIIHNPCNYFQYIVIIILLHLVTIERYVFADRGISSTWSTVPETLGHLTVRKNSSLEHIYLRDITKNGNSSGKTGFFMLLFIFRIWIQSCRWHVNNQFTLWDVSWSCAIFSAI